MSKIWKKKDGCRTIQEVSLRNFDISDPAVITEWNRKFCTDDFFIYGMDKAVFLVKQYISEDYRFCIMGDYDADGITGSCILYMGLKAAGASDVMISIPDRINEGYGTKPFHVDRIPDSMKKTCVLFVDNGIACAPAIKQAKGRGFSCIILDHHTASDRSALDMSDALVDPEAEEQLYGQLMSDSDTYCGAGLAFSFIRKIINSPSVLKKCLCFAAIGTVCDAMLLRDENYCIVKYGLHYMEDPASCTSGLYALTDEFGHGSGVISAKDLGFSYGPVINAQSRMQGSDGVADAVKLLLYDDGQSAWAEAAASLLIDVNNERKSLQSELYEQAVTLIADSGISDDRPLVIYLPQAAEGLVGIIAGKLAEFYRVPAFVLTDGKNGVLKGSGRSYGPYNMAEHLKRAAPFLVSSGGHPGACGLSLKKENFGLFRAFMLSDFPKDYVVHKRNVLEYDLEINASDVHEMINELSKLTPFGKGHEDIIFKINGFDVYEERLLSDGKSIKFAGPGNLSAFGFGLSGKIPFGIKKADMIGTLSKNCWRGYESDRIEILDMKRSGSETAEYSKDTEISAAMPRIL